MAFMGFNRYIPEEIMKTHHLCRYAVSCLWLASIPLIRAEGEGSGEVDPFADHSETRTLTTPTGLRQIRVMVEYIEMSHELFTELMFGDKPAANDSELRKQVTQLIKDGKASIMETSLCTVEDGLKALTSSAEEFIYPTEYEPPELPVETSPKEGEAPKIVSERILDAVGPTPTAFETRNLGASLEVQPKASEDGRHIALSVCPEIVYHTGNTVWAEWKGKHGNTPIQMPQFYTLRVNTEIKLVNGRHTLLAALSPKNEKGFTDASRKIMVFVRADVITPGN
jgi:hypothetical protein